MSEDAVTAPGEPAPIFVVGASRSGTNLVRTLLNAHSEIWCSGETHYFDDLRQRLSGGGKAILTGSDLELCENRFLALSHRPFGQKGEPSSGLIERAELHAVAAELGGTGDATFEAFCRLRAQRHGKPRWAEKTPRHVYRIDDMLDAFPGAKIVCVVRDPRAVIASYRDWHGAAERRGVEERPELQSDRERTRRSYNIVLQCLLWRGVVQASYAARRAHGPERVLVQPFEQLAIGPESSVSALSEWLGIGYEPEMLAVPVVNSSYATDGAGISKEPVDRWHTLLSSREIGIVQACCGRLMDELGYEREPVKASAAELGWAFATAPFAAARAAVLNRDRLGSGLDYVRRRAATGLSRRKLGSPDVS